MLTELAARTFEAFSVAAVLHMVLSIVALAAADIFASCWPPVSTAVLV